MDFEENIGARSIEGYLISIAKSAIYGILLLAIIGIVNGHKLFAQQLPTADQLQNFLNTQKPSEFNLQGEFIPKRYDIPQISGMQTDEKILNLELNVQSIVIEGVTAFSNDQISDIVKANTTSSKLILKDVLKIVDELSKLYRENGYVLSRAYIPKQTVTDGKLKLMVVEGFISEFEFLFPKDNENGGDDSKDIISNTARTIKKTLNERLENRLQSYLSSVLAERPIKITTLEEALLKISDLAGVSPSSTIVPSQNIPNSSKLIIEVIYNPITAGISYDNEASRYQANVNRKANLSLNSVFGYGEQLQFTRSSGKDFGLSNGKGLNFIAPFLNDFLFGINYQDTISHPIGGLEAFDVESHVTEKKAKLVWTPLKTRNLGIDLSLEHTSFKNDTTAYGSPLVEDKLNYFTFGPKFTLKDSLGGYNVIDFKMLHSSPWGDSNNKDSPYVSIAEADPLYQLYRFDYWRLQPIPATPLQATLALSAQQTSQVLYAPLEKSYGGASFGRGYDNSEISGELGRAATVELQARGNELIDLKFVNALTPYIFFDYAQIENLNEKAEEDGNKNLSLASTGLGIRLNGDYFDINAYGALPLTKTPAESEDGKKHLVYFITLGLKL